MRRNEFGRHTGYWGDSHRNSRTSGWFICRCTYVSRKEGEGREQLPAKKKKKIMVTHKVTLSARNHICLYSIIILQTTLSPPSLFIICKMFRISSELSVPCFHLRWTEPSCFSYCSLMRARASANAQQTAADRVSSTSSREEIWQSKKCSA